ncbi:histamine N-methyltransferase-like [Branchiostoma floridae x Branchiostoma japonicum]
MAGMAKVGRLIKYSVERYLAGFTSFAAAFETRKDISDRSYESLVPDTLPCEPGTDLRVLGIGSGSGGADCVILKKLLQRHDSVYNRVIDPSEDMIKQYKALVREDSSLGAVKFDWRQQTAEEYFQTKEDTKFNLIHAIHVLYNVEDHDATLRNMWEQLADGGYMMIAMESDKRGMGKLWYKLWEEFGQGDRLKTELRTSGDVRQWLDTRNISYVTSVNERNINVAECFHEHSKEGSVLLDFLTKTAYVTDVPEIKSMALKYIRSNSSVVDDKIIFQSSIETILAIKN